MKKKIYYIPIVGVSPLYLSACIMSAPDAGDNEKPGQSTTTPDRPAPKRVFF